MDAQSELHNLVKEIFSSSAGSRLEAEKRLIAIQNDSTVWPIFLEIVATGEDNVLFFIGQGLLKTVWKKWSTFTSEQQHAFTNRIIYVLLNRHDLSPFVRSKIEQIIGSICINSNSLQPVLRMITDINQPNLYIGLSTLNTVLESILMEDGRINPQLKSSLHQIINENLLFIAQLTVQVCYRSNDTYKDQDKVILTTSLKLLNVIISKLPVGNHLSMDTFYVLLNVIENGLLYPYLTSPLLAAETLVELMGKRYLPRQVQSTSSSTTTTEDNSAEFLSSLLTKIVIILHNYRIGISKNSSSDNPVFLQILLVLRVFFENHLDRCLTGTKSTLRESFWTLLIELLEVTSICCDLSFVLRILQMWSVLLHFQNGAVLSLMTSIQAPLSTNGGSSETSLSVLLTNYILSTSLILKNNSIYDYIDEVEEEDTVNSLEDTQVCGLLAHLMPLESRGNALNLTNADADEDRSGSEPTLILQISGHMLVTIVSHCQQSLATLSATVPSQLQASLTAMFEDAGSVGGAMSNSSELRSAAALDSLFLLRLMPLCMSADTLLPQLNSLLCRLTSDRLYSRGKAHITLMAGIVQLSTNLVPSTTVNFELRLQCLQSAIQCVRMTCDMANISPAPASVSSAVAVWLLKICLVMFPLGSTNRTREPSGGPTSISGPFSETLSNELRSELCNTMSIIVELSSRAFAVEAHILVSLSAALLSPEWSLHWLSGLVSLQAQLTTMGAADVNQFWMISKQCGRLTALVKLFDCASARTRQGITQDFLSHNIHDVLIFLGQSSLQCLHGLLTDTSMTANGSGSSGLSTRSPTGKSTPGLLTASVAASSQITSLVGALLCLGGRQFGTFVIQYIQMCTAFLTSLIPLVNPSNSLFSETCGMIVMKQILQLCRDVLQAIPHTQPTLQVELMTTIIQSIAPTMIHDHIRVQLLTEVIETGWMVVDCHWQSASAAQSAEKKPLSVSQSLTEAGTSSPSSVLSSVILNMSVTSGLAVQPLAVTLLQFTIACLENGAAVSPDVAVLSVELPLKVHKRHSLFCVSWFLQQHWHPVTAACMHAVMLRTLSGHVDCINDCVVALLRSKRIELEKTAGESVCDDSLVQFIEQQVTGFVGRSCPSILEEAKPIWNSFLASGMTSEDKAKWGKFDESRLTTDLLLPISALMLRYGPDSSSTDGAVISRHESMLDV